MIIVAIDPGLVNLGYAVYDSDKKVFVTFGKYALKKDIPKKKQSDYAYLVKSFVERSQKILASADIIAIEIQMQARMKVIATALRCFYWTKAEMVSPLKVRRFFDISCANYAKNKRASIKLAPKLLSTPQELHRFDSYAKKDDVADAIILARFWDYHSRGESYL